MTTATIIHIQPDFEPDGDELAYMIARALDFEPDFPGSDEAQYEPVQTEAVVTLEKGWGVPVSGNAPLVREEGGRCLLDTRLFIHLLATRTEQGYTIATYTWEIP